MTSITNHINEHFTTYFTMVKDNCTKELIWWLEAFFVNLILPILNF